MARQPLQVIVIPFRKSENVGHQFAVFHRADNSMWQFIAGGAEDDETAEETARREAEEEAGIPKGARFFRLDSRASVPKTAFSPTEHWPKTLFVVPEYSFAVDVSGQELDLSHEHDKMRWLSFKEATRLLTWESNRIALWELNERLNTEMTSSKPHRIMVAVDDLKLADVCRQHGYGIEIQSFLKPEIVPELQRALGDLQPRSLHGPFGDLCAGSYDPMIREVTRHRFELAYRFARELECPDIILHHGYVPGTSAPQNWLSRCVSFWHDFLDGKEASVRYHVENMLEWDAVLLAEVIDAINDPRVDVCLDIGHCHCNSRENPIAWIERLGPRIGWVHLHNNHGESDEHLALDQGTIPIDEVCRALLEYAPAAVWCLESRDEGIPTSIEWIRANGFG